VIKRAKEHRASTVIAVILTGLLGQTTASLAVDSWGSFRNGGPSRSADTLPLRWSPERGIAWQTELQGYGQSAPVIHNDRLVVTSVLGPNCEQVSVQCFSLASGDPLWNYQRNASNGHPSNYMNSRAAPTPIVDDRGVYAFFETGDFVSLDWNGQLRWHRDEAEAFGKFQNNHGIGASPAADDESLYLLIEHDGPSSLVAIEKLGGETRWSTERASTKSWASPITTIVNGEGQVIVSSGGTVAGYRTSDGQQLWSIDGMDGNSVPSPVVEGGRLLVAARLPEFTSDGDVRANCCLDLTKITDSRPSVLWRADKAICEYASPVVSGRYAYFVSKASVLHCLDVATGAVAYRQRLSLDCWATPIVAGDFIYFFAKNGHAKVVRSGPTYEEIAVNALWDPNQPPAPLEYVEAGSDGGGHGDHGDHGQQSGQTEAGQAAGGPGGGMMARLMAGDANGDGVLEGDEIPGMLRDMLARIDTDGDGRLSRAEMDVMAKSFADRRKDAAASARDPIVYGVAAADGRIVVRTGTRLYVVSGTN
jgi:outer membrane protein assembly factor BamB